MADRNNALCTASTTFNTNLSCKLCLEQLLHNLLIQLWLRSHYSCVSRGREQSNVRLMDQSQQLHLAKERAPRRWDWLPALPKHRIRHFPYTGVCLELFKAKGNKRHSQPLQSSCVQISLSRSVQQKIVEHACKSQPVAQLWQEQSALYLVDSLPHEILLHGDVVANEFLHGAAQQTVVEEFVQVFLVFYRTQKRTISQETEDSST